MKAQTRAHLFNPHMTLGLTGCRRNAVFLYLLSAAFVRSLVLVVDATKVGDDDGDGQGDHQHAAQGADGTEDLSGNRLWHHVSVPRI